MALTQLDYPVTGAVGSFENIFPSQKALNVNFNRKDGIIDRIRSGTGGLVEIRIIGRYDQDLVAGDFVVWSTDSYYLRSSKVVERVNNRNILVDEIFSSSDITNGFVNYRKNWLLEARFVEEDTATDQQDNVALVIDDFSQIPNALNGDLSLDLSIVKDILTPNFDIATGLQPELFKVFKFQYRESYETNRDDLWQSPNVAPYNDTPLMIVLASKPVAFNNFSEGDSFKGLFALSYPVLMSYFYSSVNEVDTLNTEIKFDLNQYTLGKSLILSSPLGSLVSDQGVFNLFIDTNTLEEDTVFISVGVTPITSNNQYDLTQYDPAQYA